MQQPHSQWIALASPRLGGAGRCARVGWSRLGAPLRLQVVKDAIADRHRIGTDGCQVGGPERPSVELAFRPHLWGLAPAEPCHPSDENKNTAGKGFVSVRN